MTKTRILLVDDHQVVRMGLRMLLGDQPELQVVGEAETAADAVRAVEQLRPEIVLMDVRLPGEGGIQATEEITRRFPETQVIMLTSFADDDLVIRAIAAGAMGYVLKQVGTEELLRAIAAVRRGEALLDSSSTARLLSRVREGERKAEQDAFRELSKQELKVLVEVARGKTNAEIGKILYLSENTVRHYVSTILEKLHLTNRIELATYAVQHHIFE
ncbi:MAG: response regulator transcription factor [Chloroflexi bacterium]|nr:response regulator transcription factor [Chloroflexota bacterium]